MVDVRPFTILVADDSHLNLRLLSHALLNGLREPQRPPAQILTATSPEEAMRLAAQRRVDVFITDEDFGSESAVCGSEMIRDIRSKKLGKRSTTPASVPIVSCTSITNTEHITFAGANVIWKKPFPAPETMWEIITSLVGKNA